MKAISYWDFNGKGNDAYVQEDGTPRESYHRLKDLLAKWRNQA
jgi:hypothetical protein